MVTQIDILMVYGIEVNHIKIAQTLKKRAADNHMIQNLGVALINICILLFWR